MKAVFASLGFIAFMLLAMMANTAELRLPYYVAIAGLVLYLFEGANYQLKRLTTIKLYELPTLKLSGLLIILYIFLWVFAR